MIKIKNIREFGSERVISVKTASKLINISKSKGKIAGLCHGGFDLVHPGHVKHFESAKKLCDVLFVSITSDRFIKKRKGSGRPVYNEKLRAYMISSIRFVDYVVIANFNSGIEIIKALKPRYYIKGPDYKNSSHQELVAEKLSVESVRGEILFTMDPKLSTTSIISYIKHKIR